MKKLLLGSMLVLGATSFGAAIEDIATNHAHPAVLNIQVRGTVIDTTKHALIVRPVNMTGSSTDLMVFNFNDLQKDETKSISGNYEAGIYQNGNFVDGNYKIESSLKRGTGAADTEFDVNGKAKLKYTHREAEKVPGRPFIGTIEVEAKGVAVGEFVDNGVKLEVLVKQ